MLSSRVRDLLHILRADRSPADLRERVTAHLATVRAAAERDPFVDLPRAEEVGAVLFTLLHSWPDDPDAQRWIAAACRYFAERDDGDPDLDSIVGFDDDAEVVNYVLQQIHRTDLALD